MNDTGKIPNHIVLQEELERRILHGLTCEWEEARWILKAADRARFHMPGFAIRHMNSRWGYWSSEKTEICLSRNLVHNHSWESVREVLIHEMAHQYADQVLMAGGEPPHGPMFKRACYLLRANPQASGNFPPLDDRIRLSTTANEDKIMVRVKKLMALAQSRNRHEAEAAMTKAHEFITKYHVDLLARDKARCYVSVFLGKPVLRHFREDYQLSTLLQEFYFVHCIWVPAYVIEKGKMGRVLEITGTVQNIKIAAYVFDFVKRFIDRQWHQYNQNKSLNRYRKTDFSVGVLDGFRSKLELQTNRRVTGKNTLYPVRIDDPLLKKHVDYIYPRKINIKGRSLRRDKQVLKDGINLGKGLVIHKGIIAKGPGGGLLT